MERWRGGVLLDIFSSYFLVVWLQGGTSSSLVFPAPAALARTGPPPPVLVVPIVRLSVKVISAQTTSSMADK